MTKRITKQEKQRRARIGANGGRRAASHMTRKERRERAARAAAARHHMSPEERARDFAEARQIVQKIRGDISARADELVAADGVRPVWQLAAELEREFRFFVSFDTAVSVIRIAMAKHGRSA